jgi:hypothetical protein
MSSKVRTETVSYPSVRINPQQSLVQIGTREHLFSVIGSEQPKWRQTIAQGGDATGNLSVDITRHVVARPGASSIGYTRLDPITGKVVGTDVERFSGFASIPSIPLLQGVSTEASNKALSRILSQVRDQTKGFAAVTFLGELGDTVRQIRQPLTALRQGLAEYMGAVRRKTRRFPRHRYPSIAKQHQAVNKMVSGTYLEYTFGFQPLLNDCNDAVSALAKLVRRERPVRTLLVGRGTDEWKGGSGQDQQLANYFYFRRDEEVRYFVKRIYRACYTPTVQGLESVYPPLDKAKAAFGFTWADFVPDVWNCLPWSFVLDYFANIGEILECGFTGRDNLTWCYQTDISRTLQKTECQLDVKKVAINAGTRLVYYVPGPHMGYVVVERTGITRTRGVTLPLIPTFTASLPGMKQGFNLAALLTQQSDIRKLYPRG